MVLTIFNKFLGVFMRIFTLSVLGLISSFALQADTKPASSNQADSAVYTAKDYSYLLGMAGFSDELLKMHFTLYQGYVKNTNLIMSELASSDAKGSTRSYDYGAVKRRFGWEYDGMKLHEYYFDNLGGKGDPSLAPNIISTLTKQFGSYELWKTDFISTGMMRGIGWVILCKDNKNGRLFNVWINEHDLGHLAGSTILLVMDVFEHAYMPQYGLDREKYITAFFSNIDWSVVNQRSKP